MWAEGKNAKLASLDEDGMVRPSEKVEDGFLLANKTLELPQLDVLTIMGFYRAFSATPSSLDGFINSCSG